MVEIRTATEADAGLIVAHRRAMFEGMGRGTPAKLEEMSRTFAPWVRERLADGRYLGWILFAKGQPVASAGLWIMDWPPVPHDAAGTSRGYVLNVFVDVEFRRRGLARRLIEECVAEARRRGIGVMSLHASEEGRPLYEGLGFKAANEMQRRLGEE